MNHEAMNRLEERKLPDLLTFSDGTPVRDAADWAHRRTEILDLLLREEYGMLPPAPEKWSVTEDKPVLRCAGSAWEHHAEMHLTLVGGAEFSFPFSYTIPTENLPCRAFLHINFRPDVPDRYMPVEELVDNGFAVFSFCYEDVTTDNGDFSTGLAGILFAGRERTGSDPGKIALWSYAASRVCDFMLTLPELDPDGFAVAGHSRLGKTALLTGALDPRFRYVLSNCAGCSGDAPMRGKAEGNETVSCITTRYPYWFCPDYRRFAGRETELPFDQHFLLAMTAPRFLLIGSAEKDNWADQPGQFLSCLAAGEVWRLLGSEPGLPDEEMPTVPTEYSDGAIGFHFRRGTHYFSRSDWGAYMRFIAKH